MIASSISGNIGYIYSKGGSETLNELTVVTGYDFGYNFDNFVSILY